ncbi:hypothetical protein [Streptomyces sp. NPDC046805]|uniref:hypothetical protein n=1 Tax=Streptomyces sp. NPDC046805 TaxID=3155134 RepID=UPI0033C5E701
MDDFHVNAETGAVLDKALVAAALLDLADRGVHGGHLVDQVPATESCMLAAATSITQLDEQAPVPGRRAALAVRLRAWNA